VKDLKDSGDRQAFTTGAVNLLPTDPTERKQIPLASGVLDYFTSALIEVGEVSFKGNEQHNPGQPLHWARGKSMDHSDTMLRHFTERGTIDTDGVRHSAKMCWRALAILQEEMEAAGSPIARGATFSEVKTSVSALAMAIDAEGGIGIVKRESNRRESYTLRVSVYNTKRIFLETIQKEFGGNILTRDRKNPLHAISYSLVWSHKKAADVLRAISAFLVIKKEQARIALEFSALATDNNPGRRGTSINTLKKFRELKSAINALNLKGRPVSA